jgi:hypothetical protein
MRNAIFRRASEACNSCSANTEMPFHSRRNSLVLSMASKVHVSALNRPIPVPINRKSRGADQEQEFSSRFTV